MDELIVATAGTGVARTSHYVTPTGASAPIQTLLLEPQRTNLCIRSEEFDTWTLASATVTANTTTAPDGTLTADTLSVTSSGGGIYLVVTFTGDGEKCAAMFLRAGTATKTRLTIRDQSVAVNRHVVDVTWTAGVPTLATVAGAGTLYPVEALANGWYRILFSATGVVAANVHRYLITDNEVVTGTVGLWGAQAENAIVPSSYIKTQATTVTRNADSLYFPFTAPPQAMTVYVRGVENNRATDALAGQLGIVQISDAAGNDAYFAFINRTGSAGYSSIHDPAAISISGAVGTTVTRGDLVEFAGGVRASGAAFLSISVNGGATTSGADGTAQAFAATWSGPRLYLNSQGSVNPGQFAFTHVIVAAGEQTMATMRSLAGVA